MRPKIILILTSVLLVSITAGAYVIGGSNLGIFGYPECDCSKPDPPYKPYSFSDQMEIDLYNQEVRSYNLEIELYVDCVREYIDNANNDIDRIKEKIRSALAEARTDY